MAVTEGVLRVLRPSEVRGYQIGESAVLAHPAITGGSIIVKDVDQVICWSF